MLFAVYMAMAMVQGPQGPEQGDLLSARDALHALSGAATVTESDAEVKRKAFRDKVNGFPALSRTMSPREAAEKWLALIDEGDALPRVVPGMGADGNGFSGGGYGSNQDGLSMAFEALPRPEVWPEIVACVSKRPAAQQNTFLLVLFARLMGRDDEMLRLAKGLSGPGANDEESGMPTPSPLVDQLKTGVLQRRRDLAAQIASCEANPSGRGEALGGRLPDLVNLVGTAKAGPVLLRIFRNAKATVYIDGRATTELAKKVVLQNLGKIKRPPWELVQDSRDAVLADKLAARYGLAPLCNQRGGDSGPAQTYLQILLDRGDVVKAADLLRKAKGTLGSEGMPGPMGEIYEYPGIRRTGNKNNYEALLKLQKLVPKQDLWPMTVDAANADGRQADAAKRIESVVHDPKTAPKAKLELYPLLIELHGSLGDAAAMSADYLEAVRVKGTKQEPNYISMEMLPFAAFRGDARLLRAALQHDDPDEYMGGGPKTEELIREKRFRDAEELLTARPEQPGYPAAPGDIVATELCRIYYKAGRPRDVVAVLDGFPNWSTDDLGKSLGGNPYGGEFPGSGDDSKPLGYYAAWAFAKTGRRQLAVQVVERLLWQDYDDPAAFTLLNQVAGGDALGFYDALIADNPLTTAPLTWKADLLRSQGRLKEAERCARAAVALDPGEVRQSGRTFKTYEVLGALLKAEGDAKGAQACLRKVGAARIAERASKFAKFGLLPQAIEAYRQSLKTSPDCYTEALLASCLGRCGKTAEALRHEAQAFRLLPESVGPASDLTFVQEALWNRDCEAIARAAFDRPSPSTAAACYLKAVVEDAAGQPRAAVRDLRKAVALNPRFGLALKDLADLGDRGFLTQAQTEEVQLQLIALGARQNAIDSFDLNDFDDMRSAYGALERMIAKLPPRPQGPLYPLHKAAQSRSFAMDEMDVDAGLMERQRLGNLVGGYFAGASDIQEILSYASMVSSMQR